MGCQRLWRCGSGLVAPAAALITAGATATALAAAPGAAAAPRPPTFAPAQRLAGADGGTEPRVSIGSDGRAWVVTNARGTAVVYGSADGGRSWRRTPGIPAGQVSPTIDTDIVTTTTGRLVAVELDGAGIAFAVSYSDDGGATWVASTGLPRLADQDRPWLAAGPDDRVYLLFHNLLSGAATHNMFVETSVDGGASFGPPVPVTVPGSPAWLDLQCADSGGPSALVVDPRSGRVYAFWGTRSSSLGGCGASLPPHPFEINVVGATRVWVAASADGSLGSWITSLAVDDAATENIVGMQLSPGAVDRAGNVYVVYPESPRPYPDYTGAAVRLRIAPPDLDHWSAPLTIAPGGEAGNVLVHVVAGDPGNVAVAYFAGVMPTGGGPPLWYATVTQLLGALGPKPTSTSVRLSEVPAYRGTASQLMGACASPGPLQGVENGFACGRSADVWGIALDTSCRVVVTWPSVSATTDRALGAQVDATWVDWQSGGPTLCSAAPGQSTAASGVSPTASQVASLVNTGRGGGGGALSLLPVVSLGAAALAARRRRTGTGHEAVGRWVEPAAPSSAGAPGTGGGGGPLLSASRGSDP